MKTNPCFDIAHGPGARISAGFRFSAQGGRELRQVLECGSPLPLYCAGGRDGPSCVTSRHAPDFPRAWESARGLPHSKTLRNRSTQTLFLRLLCLLAAMLLAAVPSLASTRYVDASSTNATPPFTSWATAAATIQQAVDAAAPGDEIVVTNGTYATGGRAVGTHVLANRVAVDKPIALRSVNGPQFTIIRGEKAPGGGNGEGAIRCVYLADGASLCGFTLTNGATRLPPGSATPEKQGGGVWSASTRAMVTNCVIVGNSAGWGGGGAFGGTLYNCTLTGNSSFEIGGGASDCALYNCTLTGNRAEGWAGGARFCTLYNCTLTGNSASYGGGVTAPCELYNCTLSGNWAKVAGGAASDSGFGCLLYNCIVYSNRAGYDANYSSWLVDFEYSCTTPLPPGKGNIAADPQLATATHLLPTSPCIGAGNPAHTTGVDIDGEPWANPPAMGADQPGSATGPLSLWIETGYTNVATGYAVSFTARNAGTILRSVWDFGDGTSLTNQPFATHAWSTPGAYTVRLTGYNDSHVAGVTATVVVTIGRVFSYYVNLANPNPLFPYGNWETAARTIQDAIGAGTQPGRLVLVANGVYRSGTVETNGLNRVALTNQVTVRSLNGPKVTVIEGEMNGMRCAYVGNGAVLSGFTLTKGTALPDLPGGDGGGVRCHAFGAVTNCVLTGNSAYWLGGGACGGTLYNCMLTGNSAQSGGGASRSMLYNCTLSGNSGGGAWRSTLYNCIVYFNRAPIDAGYWQWTAFDHCCTTPLPPGPGNIDADPRFVNAATGDFRLRPDSPCIDAGTNLTALISTDVLGLPRIMDGNADGIARVDMGAYEFNPYRFEPALELTADGLVFTIRGEPGKLVRIDRTRDLVTWEPIATVPIPASGQTLIDPAATTEPFLFYRAVSVP